MRWFSQAAQEADREAIRSLGFMYATGVAVRPDPVRAYELFSQAADLGDPVAKFNLASQNIREEGQHFGLARTVSLLEDASAAGIVEAEARLGDLLAAAEFLDDALRWYIRAAEHGHFGAMGVLATAYRDGALGVVDPVLSLRWFLGMLSVGRGDGMSSALDLARGLNDDQIREAAVMAGAESFGEAIISTVR